MNDSRFKLAAAQTEPGSDIYLDLSAARYHGLICGSDRSWANAVLRHMVSGFSKTGVPVLIPDTANGISGIIKPADKKDVSPEADGEGSGTLSKNLPAVFFDPLERSGIALRTTVSELGPSLTALALSLRKSQTGLLKLIFKIADDQGLLLMDTRDLKAMLNYSAECSDELEADYGRITKTSVTSIIRSIVALEALGAERYIGEPALDVRDLMARDADGFGMVNILEALDFAERPELYSAFLLYIMSELSELLNDQDAGEKPAIAIFINESELFFKSLPKELVSMTARLLGILSKKGAAIYFAASSPDCVPDDIMAMLSMRICLPRSAYTASEKRILKKTAGLLRAPEGMDAASVLDSLGDGEALISVPDGSGKPGFAKRAVLAFREGYNSEASDDEKLMVSRQSLLYSKYHEMEDRDSCYEFMQRRKSSREQTALTKNSDGELTDPGKKEKKRGGTEPEKDDNSAGKDDKTSKSMKKAAKSVLSTTAGTIGREVGQNIGSSLGGSFGKTLGGNVGASLGRNILGTLFKN